jgi:hypothetical protein
MLWCCWFVCFEFEIIVKKKLWGQNVVKKNDFGKKILIVKRKQCFVYIGLFTNKHSIIEFYFEICAIASEPWSILTTELYSR